jgi:hypothetical protein
MEKKVIEIEIQDNSKTLKQQYKEAVLEVQKLADAFGATSIEVQNASKRAAELKDQIEDVNDAIQAQKGEGTFIALGKSLSSVASGFSAVEGAMGLVGAESEDVQKAMLRVQSAMALAQGLEGLEDAGRAFSQLKVTINGVVTSTVSGFQKMSLASKAFAITGIGLIITGLALVITYWEDVSKAIGLSTDEQDKYVAKQKRMNEQSKEMRENVSKESASFATLIAQLKATNSGSKEREDLIKKINKEYGTTLKNIKDERDFQSQLNTELASYLEYQKAKYLLQRNEEKIQKNLDVQMKLESEISKGKKEQIALEKELAKEREKLKSASTFTSETKLFSDYDKQIEKINKVEQAQRENNKSLIENQKELGNAQLRFEDYGRSANDASNKVAELTNNGKKYVEQTVDATKDVEEEKQGVIFDTYELQQRILAEMNAKELKALDDAEKAEKTANQNKLKLEEDYLNEIEALQEQNFQFGLTEQQREIQSVNDKYFTLEELAKDNAEELAIIEQAKTNELGVINKKYTDEEIARQNTLQQTKLKLTADAFGAIGQLIESFNAKDEATARKQFKIAKAFNLSSALVNTALAVTSALAMRPDQQVFPGQRFVEAGIAGTTGLASVVKIASTQFGGGGGGGGVDVPNPSSIIAPNLNVVGNTGINQLATLQQQPVKAYVVSNDITSAQQFDLKVQQTAQL